MTDEKVNPAVAEAEAIDLVTMYGSDEHLGVVDMSKAKGGTVAATIVRVSTKRIEVHKPAPVMEQKVLLHFEGVKKTKILSGAEVTAFVGWFGATVNWLNKRVELFVDYYEDRSEKKMKPRLAVRRAGRNR